ncbi:hypothetical protein F5B19DRAFT_182434 [Rostrohypoxylon terebratum]|nr:hypothetical protein F5B19DRAFT_182434 [Rostrohypoxylon terebratum]
MDSGSKDPLPRISDASQKCLDLFELCLARNPDTFTELEETERRFRAWTNNLKVFRQGASLDMQLHSEKHSQIRPLESVAPDQTIASAKSALEILSFGSDGCLKRLEKIAALILQAIQGGLIRRTIVFAKKHKDFPEILEIFSMVILSRYSGLGWKERSGNIGGLKELTPTPEQIMAPRPEGLFLALVKTSVVRHFKILYERNRRDREQARIPEPVTGNDMRQQFVSPRLSKSATGAVNPTAGQDRQDNDEQSVKPPTVLSIDVDCVNKEIARTDSGNAMTSEKSVDYVPPISEAGVTMYPMAPKISDGEKEGTCPICLQVFPAEELKGDKWIKHATKDINPYTCIFEESLKKR